jgi:hypothetical protein
MTHSPPPADVDVFANTAVVVVHGVGDQCRGESALAMARSLGEAMQRFSLYRSVEIRTAPELAIDTGNTSQNGYYWIPATDIGSSGGAARLRVSELYWGDKSQYRLGFVGHVVSFIRLIFDLPRLATFGADKCRLYQFAVRAIGVLLIARAVCVLATLWITSVLQVRQPIHMHVFWVDLVVNASLITFFLTTIVWRKRLTTSGINTSLSLVCITISFFVLESIPYAFYPVEVTELSAGSTRSIADWFYAPNTLIGLWPYLEYCVIWLGTVASGVAGMFAFARRSRGAESYERRFQRALDAGIRVGQPIVKALTVSCMFAAPLLFCLDLVLLINGVEPDGLFDPRNDPSAAAIVSQLVRWAVWPAAAVAGLLLLSAHFRQSAKPLLELLIDLQSYLLKAPLRNELISLLRGLLEQVAGKHGGRVIIVAHSLGSAIAWDTLAQLPRTEAQRLSLVTMGSPLPSLRRGFPAVYGSELSWSAVLDNVQSWQNRYRFGDAIGQQIAESRIDNARIGGIGHTGYFKSPEIAGVVLSLMTLESTAPEPAVGLSM